MKSPRPDSVTPRTSRLAKVKFVALPMEPAPAPVRPTDSSGFFASLRSTVFRVIGCLEAARP